MITQIQGQYRTRLSFKIPVVLKKKLVCVKYAMKDFFSQNILIRSQKDKTTQKTLILLIISLVICRNRVVSSACEYLLYEL